MSRLKIQRVVTLGPSHIGLETNWQQPVEMENNVHSQLIGKGLKEVSCCCKVKSITLRDTVRY